MFLLFTQILLAGLTHANCQIPYPYEVNSMLRPSCAFRNVPPSIIIQFLVPQSYLKPNILSVAPSVTQNENGDSGWKKYKNICLQFLLKRSVKQILNSADATIAYNIPEALIDPIESQLDQPVESSVRI